jgi:GMP synthase-like glutamine amidotransferase
MRVLAFRHVPFEGVGSIEPLLHQRGIGLDYADLYKDGARDPDIAAYDGLIFLGGPMSANDPLPYLDRERALIAKAVERGQPLLGICLGSQLIARVLGAEVRRNGEKEIGWFDIHLTESAADDALFRGIGAQETVFHWHADTWELPPGAARLAWSQACRNQAFRAGNNIYGMQFHLEVTPAMIADWQLQDENCGDVRELPTPLDPHAHSARQQELSKVVFGRWCDIVSPNESPQNSLITPHLGGL